MKPIRELRAARPPLPACSHIGAFQVLLGALDGASQRGKNQLVHQVSETQLLSDLHQAFGL